MHVLTVLDWVRSLWHSLAVDFAPAPNLLRLADLLEVYEEAIASPQAALQLFAQQLVSHSTAGIQFASVALLSSSEGDSFGIAALHGRGSEHFPAVLQSNKTAWLNGKRGYQQRRFTLSPKQVFLTADSNWAVTDVHSADMEAPCFYECLSSARGLPHEAQWLSREGMRSMLTLPCTHEGSVWGVLTVASPQSHFGKTQVALLQQLCHQITPLVVKARDVLDSVLCNGQFSRCQSTNELATCMLDEIVQLDKILVKRINQCAAESALEDEKAAAMKAPPSTPESCSLSQNALPTPPLMAPPLARHTPNADGPLQSCPPMSRADLDEKDGGNSTSMGAHVHADISALLGEAMDAGTLSALTDTTTNSSAGTPRTSGQYSHPGTNVPPYHPKRRGGGSGNCPTSCTSIPGSNTNCPPSRTSIPGSSGNGLPSRTSVPGSSSNSPRTSCLGRATAAHDCSLAPAAVAQQCSSQPQQQQQGIHSSRQLPEKPASAPALMLRGGRRSGTGRHSQQGVPDVNAMGYNTTGHNSGNGYNMGRRGTVQPGAMIQTQEAGWGEVQDDFGVQGGQCPSRLGCRVSTSQQGDFSTCGGSEMGYESGSGEEGGGRVEVWEQVGHSYHHRAQWGEGGEDYEVQGPSQYQHHQQHPHKQQEGGHRHGGSMPCLRHDRSNRRGELDEVDMGLPGGSEEEEEGEGGEGGRRGGGSGFGTYTLSRASSVSATLSDRSPSSGGDDPKLWGLDVFMNDSSMLDDFSRRLQGSAAYVAAVAQAQDDQSAMVMAASDRASTNR
ncbi:hypothetical protein DUNSADRAFT_15880 [Dunaliella salina]|uniref:GAF domain-containing protein n=1 Tax=Dunaliella salina TaxID=3046 RepID=A0ABQ7G4Q4_DUNSA|nr:hypothetical protein DUNSADRAFT_15880 [Dunaliella salina]|eukprot:KAF5829581.1 hypothetical protein DUNSADRAFT_15880 [Dunaliella salina]